ncbi:MAG: ABC transporter ATP-binding protein, partial [Candidatus Angelobacter sp.]
IGELGADIIPAVLRIVAMGAMVLITMGVLNLRLTLLVFPLLPVFYLLQKRYFRRLRNAADLAQEKMGEISAAVQEHLAGMIQLQLLNRTALHGRTVARLAADGVRARMRQRGAEIQFSAASMAVIVLGSTVILGYGGREVMRGALTVGGLVAFYSYVAQLLGPLSSAVDLQSRVQRVGTSIRRILDIGEEGKLGTTARGIFANHVSGAALEFESVFFSHRQNRLVLDNLDMAVYEGEKIALVGHSGCGKTTIANLAAGLYAPDHGRICVQGRELNDLGRRGLRALISLVPQDPVLFNATLRENLLYGNPQATSRELAMAIEAAQLDDVLRRLPGGFDEHLGPLGKKLSGGEKKRVALARALLQHPRILILDEVTGALDSVTSCRLMASLGQSNDGRTIISISHKPATMAWADKIVVLEHGRITDQGSHLELSVRCNLYQHLYAGTLDGI